MDKKRRIFNIVENYINQFSKSNFEEFYGEGAKVSLKQITYLTQSKSILVEANITLGDKIDEFSLEPILAEFLLEKALNYFCPRDNKYSFVITFDS